MAAKHSLNADERLRRPGDFRRVFDRRCSTATDWLIVYACENGLAHCRIGLSVGKRWGKAHLRNRIRRLYREAFRLSKDRLPAGLDLVFVPRRMEGLTLAELLKSLPSLVEKAKKKLEKKPKGNERRNDKSDSR